MGLWLQRNKVPIQLYGCGFKWRKSFLLVIRLWLAVVMESKRLVNRLWLVITVITAITVSKRAVNRIIYEWVI